MTTTRAKRRCADVGVWYASEIAGLSDGSGRLVSTPCTVSAYRPGRRVAGLGWLVRFPTNLARRRRTRRSAIGAVHATAITWPTRTSRLKPISGSGCVPDETGFLGVAQGSLGFLVQVPEASHPFLPGLEADVSIDTQARL